MFCLVDPPQVKRPSCDFFSVTLIRILRIIYPGLDSMDIALSVFRPLFSALLIRYNNIREDWRRQRIWQHRNRACHSNTSTILFLNDYCIFYLSHVWVWVGVAPALADHLPWNFGGTRKNAGARNVVLPRLTIV